MAKKQTRRSISVSRTTYERLKAFCEANNISMSQLVETRVNDFLGEGSTTITPRPDTYRPPSPAPQSPRPIMPTSAPIKSSSDASSMHGHAGASSSMSFGSSSSGSSGSSSTASTASVSNSAGASAQRPSAPVIPMTSAAARYAVEPPPPIIKPKQETNAPKPAEKRADQIFTF
jgi:hypothetical protein